MAKPANKKKERGKFLTFWITLTAVALLVSALADNISWIKHISFGWFVYATISQLLSVVELIGIWIWKKWGAYLLIAHQVIALCDIPFYQQATAQQIAEAGYTPQHALGIGFTLQIATSLTWFWALKRKWKYFE